MLQQQISELDFDTYFDVNTIQPTQQQQQQQQQLFDQNAQRSIHPTQQPNGFPQQQYFMPQQRQQHQPPQQQAFETYDWCFRQQQQQQQQQQTTNSTPVTTPGNISPSHHNRPDYFYSAQQQSNPAMSVPAQFHFNQHRPSVIIKEEETNYGFNNNTSLMYNLTNEATNTIPVNNAPVNMNNSSNNNGLSTPMSEMTFPETPQSRHSSSESNSPSPVSAPTNVSPPSVGASSPLMNAFATIDHWGKNTDKAISGCTDKIKVEDNHEVRHWRKTMRSDSTTSNTSKMVAAAVAAVAARSTPRSPVETGHQLKKVAHNAIERRYRNNINDRIRDLKNVVPALYKAKIREKKNPNSKGGFEDEDSSDEEGNTTSNNTGCDDENEGDIVDGVEVAKKLNKATILHKATEYIHHLKHTNELARRENQVLQQILAQMPGGTKVLARFQMQKNDFEQAEQQRILTERRDLLERERVERQRMLRERAAQRAALAELLPKPERRPYRRRAKKQSQEDPQQKQQADENNKTNDNSATSTPTAESPNLEEQQTYNAAESDGALSDTLDSKKTLMAMFLCLTLVSPLALDNTTEQSQYHHSRVLSYQKPQQNGLLTASTFPSDLWFYIKISFFITFSSLMLIRYVVRPSKKV